MGRPKKREQDALFDRDLADVPGGARWREWMGRVEAAIFAARDPVPAKRLRNSSERVANSTILSATLSTNFAHGPTTSSSSPAAKRPATLPPSTVKEPKARTISTTSYLNAAFSGSMQNLPKCYAKALMEVRKPLGDGNDRARRDLAGLLLDLTHQVAATRRPRRRVTGEEMTQKGIDSSRPVTEERFSSVTPTRPSELASKCQKISSRVDRDRGGSVEASTPISWGAPQPPHLHNLGLVSASSPAPKCRTRKSCNSP